MVCSNHLRIRSRHDVLPMGLGWDAAATYVIPDISSMRLVSVEEPRIRLWSYSYRSDNWGDASNKQEITDSGVAPTI